LKPSITPSKDSAVKEPGPSDPASALLANAGSRGHLESQNKRDYAGWRSEAPHEEPVDVAPQGSCEAFIRSTRDRW
jgi:hypothetical protein